MSTAPKPLQPIRLYHFPLSGHAHRVQLFLSLLGLPVEIQPVNLLKGEHKSPGFLAMNPFGQVPVIQDGDVTLADSNAILTYLALRYDDAGQWLPRDPVKAALVQRWLSAAAGPLAFGPGNARIAVLFKRPRDERAFELSANLLKVMDGVLAQQRFLVPGDVPTLADIALYTYTAHAPEGGVSLQAYAQVRRWLAEIEALPGFVGMVRSPVPEAA
ncbi:MAG: glutathione S-transferase family protein [Pseudomonadota bacterium]